MAPSRRQISKNEPQSSDLSSGNKDSTPTHILYDLNIFSEWSQDIENKHRPSKETTASGFAGKLYSTAQRSVWTFLRSVGVQTRTTSPCNLPVSLVKLVNIKLTWSTCLSPDAEYLAVLQETSVEIRCRRDNYASTIGKAKLPEDDELQWRRMAWSDDSQLLAVSFSTGAVTVLDIMCGEFFTIDQQPKIAVSVGDLSSAIAAMIFSRPSKGTEEKWDFSLTLINHQGLLTHYLLSTEEGLYEETHQFQFSNTYPQGVSSAVYSEKHALLVVTGLASPSTDLLKTKAGQEGITAWRVLSGSPYYKRVTDYEEDNMNLRGQGFLKKFTSAMYGAIYGDGMQELVLKSCLSPDGKHLLTLSTESKLCLYQMPSLTLVHSWSADQQPCGDQLSPTLAESPRKTKYLQEHPHYYKLLDIAWWSDKEVILARYSGAVLVADIESLSNLLGEFPEWFEVCPQVQEAHEGEFLSLECESRVLSGSRKRTSSEGTTPMEESDSDEDESRSLMSKTNRMFRETLFYITDMDRFEPPKKKTRLIKKTYRLISLKSTTPDELFARKIDQEEYGEALVLAKVYHLDSDLVYQRQWRKSDVTLATIHDYLSKIRKRSWVLHECLERVPNNIDAMRELLQYGLRGTDLEALVKVGQGRDKGRFIISKDIQMDESFDEYDQESVDELEAMRKKHRQNLLDQLDFDNLTLEQKELCRVRLKLLAYLDRLATYEEILGGGRFAEEHFDAKFFQKFRSQNVVEAITDYAQTGDHKAVDIMFIFLGEDTLPHRLAILSNFPETLPPGEYTDLLPLVEDGEVVDYPQESIREPDWCELPERRKVIEGPSSSAEFLYEESKNLLPFCGQPLTPQLLTKWYQVRSCDIEERSRLVDHALEFIELGMKNGIENLQSLWEDLSVLEMIVYDCNYGDGLSFKQLQNMTDLDRLKTIMLKTSPEKYALHIQKWMKPFLERCEAACAGSFQALLLQYLIDLSINDLELVFKVFECSKADQPANHRLLNTEERILQAAVDCIYACERDDQLSFVLSILECLPNRKSGSMERSLIKLHNDVDELEVLINAAEILEDYGISMTISALKDTQNDVNAATLLMKKLTRRANNREPGLTTAEWTQLQSDMSALQSKVYRCIDKYTCCEIFVESLLCSGKRESIELSLIYMEGDMESSTQSMTSSTGSLIDSQIPHKQAIDIVVRAAREYFNSSGSHADHNMELADACLRLFPPTNAKIKEELDLIQALPLLLDFGLTMIPLKVRLSQNRLELIEDALLSSRTAYKQYPKLLKLAEGLRVSECAVLQLIIQKALAQGDSKFAYKHCKNLIDKEYPDIWTECYQLASSPHFVDVDARMALLSYSLVHCSDDMIEEVLAKRMALKTEILVTRMKSEARRGSFASPKPDTQVTETDGHSESKSDWHTMFSAEAAVGTLTKTTRHTKHLLSNLGDMKWIDKTVSLISGRSSDSDINKGAEFLMQGCHPFYEDVIAACQPSIELAGTKRLEMSFSEDVLRTRKLQESLSKGADVIEDCSEVLVKCAIHALPVDITLGLGFLIALPKSGEADGCFDQLPHVPLTLRLGAYYYALQLLSSLSMSVHGSVSETISLAQGVSQQQLEDEENKVLFKKLDLYVRLMEDHSQACYLQSLGKDVDSHRFTADNEYKKQTILGLTKSMDPVHYDTAISMAKRYSVSFWDVYMTHLEYLLVDSGLTVGQVDKKLESLRIMKELLSEPARFADYMTSNVLPHVDGTDMAKRQLFYKLVDGCPCSDKVSFETHRKLLSRLIPAAPGLDYGALMEGADDPVAILRPVLKSGNVHVFSKLSAKIPTADGRHLSSSAVFNAWAQKLFTDGTSANSKVPDSTAAWVHRYESCGEYLAKMEPSDVISFLKHALFCARTLDEVPLDARQEICRRSTKYCKSNTGKSTSSRITWTEALQTTQQFQEHLERMGSEALIGLRLAEDVQVQSYHKKIDSCMSDPEKLRDVLVEMLLDGQVLELVHDILDVIPLNDWSVRDALSAAVVIICKHLRERQERLVSNGKPTLKAFENLICQVGEHQKEGGQLVSSEDVMSLFRPVIPDTSIEMKTRLLSLDMLEQNLELTKADKLMVLLYRTQAITLTHWPEKQVDEKDVDSEQARIALFMCFLEHSMKLDQFLSLSSLINVWPKMKDVNSLWMSVIDAVLAKVGDDGAETVVSICLTESLPQGVVQHAYSMLRAQQYFHQAAILAIRTRSPVLQDDLIDMMGEHYELFSGDELVLRAVFEHHLTVSFVDTELFKPLVGYLKQHQREAAFLEPSIVVNELLQAKCTNEAAEVDKACKGQKGSSTLGAAAGAISAIGRWWRKD